MSTLSQILETLNECVNVNTDAFTVFEHGSEKVCFISDLLNLSKSKKPILIQLPSTPEDLKCENITEEMLESEEDIYPKVSPLIGLDKLTYTVKGYLAVKNIVEYENFILLSYLKDSNLTALQSPEKSGHWCWHVPNTQKIHLLKRLSKLFLT